MCRIRSLRCADDFLRPRRSYVRARTPSHWHSGSLDVSTRPTGSTLPRDLRIPARFSDIPVDVCVRAFMRNALASSDLGLAPRLDLGVHASVHAAFRVLWIVRGIP